MTRTTRAAVAVLVAGSASAQPDMLITVNNFEGDTWRISSEFLSPTVFPIVQIWIDAGFDLTGDGSVITITDYNPAYDTILGPATVTNGPVASFFGFSNSFFGTPDPSNPLYVLEFAYAGAFDELELSLVGQNSALFEMLPSSIPQLYQDPFGNPGELTWDVQYIPAPSGAVLLFSGAMVAGRRRRV